MPGKEWPYEEQLSGSAQNHATLEYKPLGSASSEIRILTLLPGSGETPIQCELHHTFIGDSPEYEALSYVWGPHDEFHSFVFLDRWRVQVTPNLLLALLYLRDPTKSRTLWVDALCIDQNNAQERSEQVRIMWKIYTSATNVLAWLGETENDSDEALALIERLHDLSGYAWSLSNKRPRLTPQAFRDAGIEPALQPWNALMKLFNRPYWSRIWVIQELYHGSRGFGNESDRCIVGCGKTWVPFSQVINTELIIAAALDAATDYYTSNQEDGSIRDEYEEPLAALSKSDGSAADDMFRCLNLLQAYHTPGSPRRYFLYLFPYTRNFEASDARDRIYALLNTAPGDFDDFPIDYECPADQVLQAFAKYAMRKYQLLDILQFNRLEVKDTRPSWILDDLPVALLNPAWLTNNVFHASGHRAPSIGSHEDDAILVLKGLRVGAVERVSGPHLPPVRLSEDQASKTNWHSSISADPRFLEMVRYLRSIDEQGTLWRMLVIDQSHFTAGGRVYPDIGDFEAKFLTWLEAAPVPDDFEPDMRDQSARLELFVRPYAASIGGSASKRCLFATGNGYMGYGPYPTQKGDVVVVLFGGSMCFVLRPKGDFYQLLGDAYVQGIMQGELVKEDSDGNVLNREDFALC